MNLPALDRAEHLAASHDVCPDEPERDYFIPRHDERPPAQVLAEFVAVVGQLQKEMA